MTLPEMTHDERVAYLKAASDETIAEIILNANWLHYPEDAKETVAFHCACRLSDRVRKEKAL